MPNIFYTVLIYPLTQIIELVFCFCEKLFDSTPLALVGVSLAVGFLTLPLYIVAEHWQQVERDTQSSMKGTVDRIKSVFKGNEQYMILSTYYKQCSYHPLYALRSAFGLLIQVPFFTAAYSCLSNMEALKGESFWFIRDLGQPDALFSIGTFTVNVLPIAMTLINCIAGAIYTKGLPIKEKIQVNTLAIVFLALLYNSPSGLVFYWTMNNIFSLVKNVFYKLKHPVKTLHIIACLFVTGLIIWIFASKAASPQESILISCLLSFVYIAPLLVKIANNIVDTTLKDLRDNFSKRTSLFIVSTIALSVLIGRLIPATLIAASPVEFADIDGYGSPVFFLNNTLFQTVGLCIVWPGLVYFLFKERVQSLLSFGFFLLLAISLLNTFVFHGNYGSISRLLVFTEASSVYSSLFSIIANLAIILLVIFAFLLLTKLKGSATIAVISRICLFTLVILTATKDISIRNGYNYYQKITENDNNSDELPKIFHLTKEGKNVILIFLDRAQNMWIEPLFETFPDLDKQFTGFTLFKNAVAFNSHTLIGAAPCFGGYEYTPEEMNKRTDELLVDKQNQSLLMLPRIFTEQGDDFSATVTDAPWANYSYIPDLSIFDSYEKIEALRTTSKYTGTWYKDHKDTTNFTITSDTLKRNLLWYSLFKAAPLALRPAFYDNGLYWTTNSTNEDIDDYLSGYAVLDYMPEITDFAAKTKNVFISFANDTTHEAIPLQGPDYYPVNEVKDHDSQPYSNDESFDSMAGAIKRVGEWLEMLQKEGVYDNSRIVIVADHAKGNSCADFEQWDGSNGMSSYAAESYHPLLMVKDFGENGSLKTNMDFMTTADVPLLLTNGIIENPTNPFTGNVLSESKKNGVLICTDRLFMPHHSSSKYVFTANNDEWWRVKDNIFLQKNWTRESQGQ